ncbi:MAG: hypothetical protein WDO71_08670 [Bacteroidota bacterium]
MNGCTAKDTVYITIHPKPVITKSAVDTICKNSSVQLSVTGGVAYDWIPAATLDDATASNPVATPSVNTMYHVIVTGANTCTTKDSIKIDIHPDPVFTINSPGTICDKDSVRLKATGGDIYSWQPDLSLNNSAVASPMAGPSVSTNYSVSITETTCNNSTELNTTITVNPLPSVRASKVNDLDCSNGSSQLNARGTSIYIWSPAIFF